MSKTIRLPNIGTDLLTVRELATYLLQQDMDAFVAIKGNGYPKSTTLMNDTWHCGTFYMSPRPRVQKEFFMEEELTKSQKNEMIKTLVISAVVSKDELNPPKEVIRLQKGNTNGKK